MLGLGLPNRSLEPGEWERILACRVEAYLDLWLGPDRWPDRWPAATVDAALHVRVGVWGPLDAAADANRLTVLVRQYPDVTSWRIRNEPQIEADGGTPASWREYLAALADLLPPDVLAKVWVPAVSPSVGPIEWLDASVAAAQQDGYAGLDCHAYGWPAEVDVILVAHRARYTGPLLITEYNPGAGRTFRHEDWAAAIPVVLAAAARHRVGAVFLFRWQWAGAPELPTSVDVRGGPVETWLATRAVGASTKETRMQIGTVQVTDWRAGSIPRSGVNGVRVQG